MTKNFFRAAFSLNVLVFLFIGMQTIRRWIDPFPWGWPSQIRPSVYCLFVLELLVALSTLFITKTTRVDIPIKALVLCTLSVVGLGLTFVFSLYLPPQKDSNVLAYEQGVTASNFDALAPCHKIEVFAEVAGESVNQWSGLDRAPYWMHDGLEKLPRDMVGSCIAAEIMKNTSSVLSTEYFNEEAVKKIYALLFEAMRLQVDDQSDVLNAIRGAVCAKNADPYNILSKTYYFDINGKAPSYDYNSKAGRSRMLNEICEE